MAYSNKPIISHILPAGPLHDGERMIPLDDPGFRSAAFQSLIEGVNQFKPNILVEHESNGESFGYVDSLFEGSDGLYARMILRDDVAKKFNEGAFRYVSPTIAWGFTDDTGEKVVSRLLELSFVGIPRHAVRQISMTDLNKVGHMTQMDESWQISQMSVRLTEETNTQEIPDMDMETLKDMISQVVADHFERVKEELRIEFAPKEEEVEEVTEAAEEPQAEEAEADKDSAKADEIEAGADEERAKAEEAESKMEEIPAEVDGDEPTEDEKEFVSKFAEAQVRIAELEAELSQIRAEKAVDEDLKSAPHLSSMREKLVSIKQKDADLYKTVIGIKPVAATKVDRSKLSERVTAGAAPVESPKGIMEAANAISMNEGISFKEAYARVSGK